MTTVFDKALGITLGHEGVYSDNPYDPGGQTKWGIIESTARNHGYSGEMEDMLLATAKDIYRKSYWMRPKFNEVALYNADIAIRLFDIGVNMGVRSASKLLQRAINVLSRNGALYKKLKVDGIIGSKTFDALESLDHQIDKKALLTAIKGQHITRYMEICENDPIQELFFRGWAHRAE